MKHPSNYKTNFRPLPFLIRKLLYLPLIALSISVTFDQVNSLPFDRFIIGTKSNKSLVQPVAVFGKDTRSDIPKKYKHIEKSIGRIMAFDGKNPKPLSCSAFCVAPDVIATAAHCLIYRNKFGRRPNLSLSLVRIGQARQLRESGPAGADERATRWNTITGATQRKGLGLSDISRDWGLLKLATPICQNRSLNVVQKDKISDLYYAILQDRVFLVAYHTNVKGMKFSGSCLDDKRGSRSSKTQSNFVDQWFLSNEFPIDPHNLLPHRCDFEKGASGSPLFMDINDESVVIGMNVAEQKSGKSSSKIPKNVRAILSRMSTNLSVSANAFFRQIEFVRNLPRPLDKNELIEVQKFLKVSKDYRMSSDGIYGTGTRQALLDFERRNHLLVTGRPTPRLLLAIRSSKKLGLSAREQFVTYMMGISEKAFAAFAYNRNTGEWGSSHTQKTIEKAMETALSRCNKKGKNCRLFALGNTIVAGLTPVELTAEKEKYRESIFSARINKPWEHYLKSSHRDDFKAFAVDRSSGILGVSYGQSTVTGAIKKSLDICESKGGSCSLYGLGNEVVSYWTEEKLDAYSAEYKKNVVLRRIDKKFSEYLKLKKNRDYQALAVDPETGNTVISEGQDAPALAIDTSIRKCSRPTSPCKIYALGKKVVFEKEKSEIQKIAIDYAKMVAPERIQLAMKSFYSDTSYDDFKALAINSKFGFSRSAIAERKPSLAIKKSLENCSRLGSPCKLYVLGETNVSDKTADEIDRIAQEYGMKLIRKKRGFELDQYLRETKYNDFKAMAFDPSSNRWGRHWNNKWHPRAAINKAITRCQKTGRKCELLALGNTIVFDMPEKRLDEIIDDYLKKVLGPSGIPVPVQAYMNDAWHQDFKVFVVDPTTGSRHPESGQRTFEIAREKAMSHCKKKNDFCKLYAVGKSIVLDKTEKEINKTIKEYKTDVVRRRIEDAYKAYLPFDDSVLFKALVIDTEAGLHGMSTGQNSLEFAISGAQEKCELHGSNCKLYALGNKTVQNLSKEKLEKAQQEYRERIQKKIDSVKPDLPIEAHESKPFN